MSVLLDVSCQLSICVQKCYHFHLISPQTLFQAGELDAAEGLQFNVLQCAGQQKPAGSSTSRHTTGKHTSSLYPFTPFSHIPCFPPCRHPELHAFNAFIILHRFSSFPTVFLQVHSFLFICFSHLQCFCPEPNSVIFSISL